MADYGSDLGSPAREWRTPTLASLIFIFFVFGAGVGGLIPIARGVWRGDESMTRRMKTAFMTFPFNSDVQEAMVRGVVALLLQLFLMGGAMMILIIGASSRHGGSKVTPWTVTGLAVFAGAAVMVIAQLAIIWFNRPRFLVPPPLRGDVGVRAARKAAREFMARTTEDPYHPRQP